MQKGSNNELDKMHKCVSQVIFKKYTSSNIIYRLSSKTKIVSQHKNFTY